MEFKFLGINVTNDLRFRSLVDKLVKKGTNRNKILKCMSSKDWGNSLETQRMLCVQYVKSGLEYASSSWSPWISNSSIQRVQNSALRSIAGLSKTYPQDFLHLETGIEPIQDRFQKNDMMA